MKYIITFFLYLGTFFCNAQTINLKQLSECQAKLYPCPDYIHAKDNTNLLGKFVGTWKGTYVDGRTYEFRFTKKEDDGGWSNDIFWDILVARMTIKKSDGSILESTMSVSDANTHFKGHFFDKSLTKYQLYYSGNAECNDKGYVYISFPDPNNLNQMRLVFIQDRDIIASCPSGYKTLMPDGKAIIPTKH